MKLLLCSATLLTLSLQCQAYWVESTGEARIVNGDTGQAREQAMQNAVRLALLQQGGSFAASQTVSNGQLTGQNLQLSGQANVNAVEIMSERAMGDRLQVTVRIDLLATDNSDCGLNGLKAAVLVPQTLIRDRSQLRYGRLDSLPQTLSQHLADKLKHLSGTSFPNARTSERVNLQDLATPGQGFHNASWLAEATESQYLLVPELLDISVGEPSSGTLGLWSDAPQREFQLQLTLFHGISGETIWQQVYQTAAEWPFDRADSVNPASSAFWQSPYGMAVDGILQRAVTDMDETLGCRPLLAQIVARQDNRVIINIGRKNGVKMGDKFSVVMQRDLMDHFNRSRALAQTTRVVLTIDQLSETTATALIGGENAALNIQANDIALKI